MSTDRSTRAPRAAGGSKAATAQEAATDVDAVVTMLPAITYPAPHPVKRPGINGGAP